MEPDQSSSDIVDRLYEVKQELALKAANDSTFRQNLQADPLSTIENEYGLPVGIMAQSGLNIEIVEEKSNTLVIPIPPSMDDMELSDDQLEAVSGGMIFELVIRPIVTILKSGIQNTAKNALSGGW